jgi:isoamylase
LGNWQNADENLVNFVGELTSMRKKYNSISKAEFLTVSWLNAHGNADVAWFNVNGEVMTEEHWNDPNNKAMIVKFSSLNKNEPPTLVLLNASHVTVEAVIPCTDSYQWKLLMDTVMTSESDDSKTNLVLAPRSVYVFEGELIMQT